MSSKRPNRRGVVDPSKRQRMQRGNGADVVPELNGLVEVKQEPVDDGVWGVMPEQPMLPDIKNEEPDEEGQAPDPQDMNTMPNEVIRTIFSKMDKNTPGRLRAAATKFNRIYKADEHLIVWQMCNFCVSLDFDYSHETNTWTNVLTLKRRDSFRQHLVIYNPSLEQLKKYLSVAVHVLLRFTQVPPPLFNGVSEDYPKLLRHLKGSLVQSAFLMTQGFHGSDYVGRVASLFPRLSSFQTTYEPVDLVTAKKILEKDLEKAVFEVTSYFPLDSYITEWKQGKRTIKHWCFSFSVRGIRKPNIVKTEFTRESDKEKLTLVAKDSYTDMIVYLQDQKHFC